MSGTDGGTPLTGSAEKEIAKKLALLNEEQRQRYETEVNKRIDRNGTVSAQYRVGVVKTLLQPISEHEQKRQIKEYNTQEDRRADDNDRRAARQQAAPTQADLVKQKPEAPAPAGDNRLSRSHHGKEKQADPMEGMRPHLPNYPELERTHKHVAKMQKGTGRSEAVGVPKQEQPRQESTQRPEASQKPKTKQEYIEMQRRGRVERLQKAAERRGASEAMQQKGAQQQPRQGATQQPEASQRPRTKQEYLEMQRRDRAERLEKAAQRRAASEVTQQKKGAQQQQRPQPRPWDFAVGLTAQAPRRAPFIPCNRG